MYKIKNTLTLVITLFLSLTSVSAFAATGDKFTMKEVKVVDLNTLKVSFTKDLLEDTSMFEFLLTSKKDDTKEISLTGITLSPSLPSELTIKTLENLVNNEEYNLVVVFASDKEGKLIENGVDGMITFKVPATLHSPESSTGTIGDAIIPTSASASGQTDSGANPTPTYKDIPMNSAPKVDSNSSTGLLTTENAATAADPTKFKTGPTETMIIIMAMLLGIILMYVVRRKSIIK